MELEIFSYLNNFSLHTILSDPDLVDIDKKKTERIAIKDFEWPEIHTVITSGYIHEPARFGFDGRDEVRDKYCEVKSSSKIINKELIHKVCTGQIIKKNELIDNPIDGRGIFSLFTYKAYQRYLDVEVKMLISAYINGVLMFIIEFPFDHPTFKNHIKRMLENSFPNGDLPGRSKTIGFAFNQYKDCKEAKLVYITPEANHRILKCASTKNFYLYLMQLKQKKYL